MTKNPRKERPAQRKERHRSGSRTRTGRKRPLARACSAPVVAHDDCDDDADEVLFVAHVCDKSEGSPLESIVVCFGMPAWCHKCCSFHVHTHKGTHAHTHTCNIAEVMQ